MTNDPQRGKVVALQDQGNYALFYKQVGLPVVCLLDKNFINRFLITGILKSTCYIDVRWFPFDVQKCDLKFGSWTHNGWLLDLQMLEADISNYISNGEWDLVGKLALLLLFFFEEF
ncbi:hypothetical protein JD844_009582 [Phrynosoma platyrhinos]|uniref:Neurotransmitter-gated ion-channel ligand-binding domain-containing protein n=1 Tax=Phrynosoma platyrhinos TaxID=52577 RepID=A0ABQ7TG33_PHRPL|nr:hypothetical protein JD844_009582 [Phrynosoma platyrhinos]